MALCSLGTCRFLDFARRARADARGGVRDRVRKFERFFDLSVPLDLVLSSKRGKREGVRARPWRGHASFSSPLFQNLDAPSPPVGRTLRGDIVLARIGFPELFRPGTHL